MHIGSTASLREEVNSWLETVVKLLHTQSRALVTDSILSVFELFTVCGLGYLLLGRGWLLMSVNELGQETALAMALRSQ